MQDALHRFGHRYLKVLFVLALAGSSSLFFMGSAVPKPPALLVIVIGAILGGAIELSYFTVSCDLTESITEGNKGGIAINALYTLAGGAASWFLFVNAALVVGWAPHDEVIGLDRVTWAKIMAALIVVVVFVLSARKKRSENVADLQAMGRAVTIMLPNADDATRLQLLSTIANAAYESQGPRNALPAAQVIEENTSEEPARHADDKAEDQHDVPAVLDSSNTALLVAALDKLGYHLVPKDTGKSEQRAEQVDYPPVTEKAADERSGDTEPIPLPGVRPGGDVSLTNHYNHGDAQGTFEKMGGDGAIGGPPFRN